MALAPARRRLREDALEHRGGEGALRASSSPSPTRTTATSSSKADARHPRPADARAARAAADGPAAAAARLPHRAAARLRRGSAAQPRQERHGRVGSAAPCYECAAAVLVGRPPVNPPERSIPGDPLLEPPEPRAAGGRDSTAGGRSSSSPAPARARPGSSPTASRTSSASGGVDPSRHRRRHLHQQGRGRDARARRGDSSAASPAAPWIGTFHSLCLRMLRRDGERIGPRRRASPSTTRDDQLALVRRLLREEDVDDAAALGRAPILSRDQPRQERAGDPGRRSPRGRSPRTRKLVGRVYARYQEALRAPTPSTSTTSWCAGARAARRGSTPTCSSATPSAAAPAGRRVPGHEPAAVPAGARALRRVHDNVCVVGDEDQSIYRFRGAEIRNILDFERDHPGAARRQARAELPLDGDDPRRRGRGDRQQRRAARGRRSGPRTPRGERIELFHAPDDRAEAAWVAQRIRELRARDAYEDCAVLYRTNAQSRPFEEAFRREPHPLPGRRRGAVLRAEGGQGPPRLPEAGGEPGGRRRVPPDRQRRRRAASATRRSTRSKEARAERRAAARGAAQRVSTRDARRARAARLLGAFLELDGRARARAPRTSPSPSSSTASSTRLDFEAYLEKTYPGRGRRPHGQRARARLRRGRVREGGRSADASSASSTARRWSPTPTRSARAPASR